jgi:hypothetical protein
LLAFTANSFVNGSTFLKETLSEAVFQGDINKTRELLEKNDFNVAYRVDLLDTLSAAYLWSKVKEDSRFLEAFYKGDYYYRHLSEDALDHEVREPEFHFGAALEYYGHSKDILPLINLLIKNVYESSLDDKSARTILEVASCIGDERTMKLVLEDRLWDRNNDLGGALSSAVMLGRFEAVKLLLQHGANKEDDCAEVDLFSAMLFGYEKIAQLLIDYGADVNKASELMKCFSTIKFEQKDLATWLIKQYVFGTLYFRILPTGRSSYVDDAFVDDALGYSWNKGSK